MKTRKAVLRWMNHRSSAEYSGLGHNSKQRPIPDEEKAGPKLGGDSSQQQRSQSTWRTVPGLLQYDEDMDETSDQQHLLSAPSSLEFLWESLDGPGIRSRTASRQERITLSSGSNQSSAAHLSAHSKSSDGKLPPVKVDPSHSFETTDTEVESDPEDLFKRCGELSGRQPSHRGKRREKRVQWVDTHGPLAQQELATVHVVEALPPLQLRVVVLLLHPVRRLFEFVQVEFEMDDPLSVIDLLKQLPSVASIPLFRGDQQYTSLCRPNSNRRDDRGNGDTQPQYQELLNTLPIQEYYHTDALKEGEILVAVPSDFRPKHVMMAASALLAEKTLTKAVQKAKVSGRALQKLKSSRELACRQLSSLSSQGHPQDERREASSSMNPGMDSISDNGWEDMLLTKVTGHAEEEEEESGVNSLPLELETDFLPPVADVDFGSSISSQTTNNDASRYTTLLRREAFLLPKAFQEAVVAAQEEPTCAPHGWEDIEVLTPQSDDGGGDDCVHFSFLNEEEDERNLSGSFASIGVDHDCDDENYCRIQDLDGERYSTATDALDLSAIVRNCSVEEEEDIPEPVLSFDLPELEDEYEECNTALPSAACREIDSKISGCDNHLLCHWKGQSPPIPQQEDSKCDRRLVRSLGVAVVVTTCSVLYATSGRRAFHDTVASSSSDVSFNSRDL